jgi:hypothetical protein
MGRVFEACVKIILTQGKRCAQVGKKRRAGFPDAD